MEYLRGSDLASVIRKDGRLPWGRTLGIVAQICDSLAEAHAMGIVHRDLKPENVLLVPRAGHPDFVKVVDFGLAKIRDDKTALDTTGDGSLLGTPFYMAPEQIRGEQVDGRTDVYAIGGVIYRCLTGLPPFEAPTPFAVLTKHLNDTLILPGKRVPEAGIPPSVDALVGRAMAKDPAQRYRGADDMRLAINEVFAALTTPGSTPSGVPAVSAGSDPSLITFPAPTPGAAPQRPSTPPPAAPAPATSTKPGLPAPAGIAPKSVTSPVVTFAAPAASGADLSRDEFERYLRRLKWRRVVFWIVLFVLLGGGGAAAIVVPRLLEEPPGPVTVEEEPNNVPTVANRIALDTKVTGTIGRRISSTEGDADWYRVEIRPMRKGVLRADLSGIPGLDLRVDMYDVSGGEPLATGNRGGPGSGEAIPGVLVDGMVYFVRVSEALAPEAVPSERISDRYTVTVRHLPSETNEGEPDDDPATALALAPGSVMNGYVETETDRDMYCVAGEPAAAPKITVTPPPGLDVALDTGGQTVNAAGPGAAESATLGPADPCVSVHLAPDSAPEGRAAVGPDQAYKLEVR
jgi:serine/threonine-protein kinase